MDITRRIKSSIALADFPRLFCLTAAVVLHELDAAPEAVTEREARRELVARVLAADELTTRLRAGTPDPISLRANVIFWRELAEEVSATLKAYKVIS